MGKKLWDTQNRIDYETSIAQVASPPVAWGVRETPAGGADTWEAFRVTVGQGVVVGLAWGLVSTIASGMLAVWQRWPWWVAPVVGVSVWAVTTAWHLTAGVSLRQSLLWKREEIERRDIDGDGVIGVPQETHLVVEVVNHDAKMTQFLHLGIDPDKAKVFAAGVLATGNITTARWTGKSGLLTRNEFEAVRDELLRGGLLRWVGGPERRQLGVELTASGRQVLRKLADPPSPTGGDG